MTVESHDSIIQGRNPLYTSCQKDYKNVAYENSWQTGEVVSRENPNVKDEIIENVHYITQWQQSTTV